MTAVWSWQPPLASRIEQSVNLLRLDGADTRRFLHGQTSAAIEAAAPGSWISSCCISPTARMRALVEVLLDGDGAWLLIHGIPPEQAEGVRQALDRVLFPADQVRLGKLQKACLITPVGADGDQLPASPAGQWQALENGHGWLLGRQLLLLASASLPPWLGERPPLPASEQERWRLGQGIPAAPGEINEDTNPFELGLADRVSLNKGCYVGQETLAKLATYDGVKQQLRRWVSTPDSRNTNGQSRPGAQDAVLCPGIRLLDADGSKAGVITSSLALKDGSWIGLALVRRQALALNQLQTGEGGQGISLAISVPETFSAPPGGAA